MLLVAVLGTSVMVHAFPAKDIKTTPVKEVKATKHPKHKADKKVKSAKTAATDRNASAPAAGARAVGRGATLATGTARDEFPRQLQIPLHPYGAGQGLRLFLARKGREERARGHLAPALFDEGGAREPAALRGRGHRHQG